MNTGMTKGWLSVGLTSGFGGLVGTLLAMEIATRFAYGEYLWGIGALLGGLTGFTAIDFRKFCAGVARSYRATIAWRPHAEYWKTAGMIFVAASSVYSCGLVPFAIIRTVWIAFVPAMTFGIPIYVEVLVVSAIMMTTAALLAFAASMRPRDMTTEAYETMLVIRRNMHRELLRETNLITMTIWLFRDLPKIVWSFIAGIPPFIGEIFQAIGSAAKIVWAFIALVFVYVHSARRTICFVDATLGAAIGFSYGSAIIGFVAGFALGVINYEIISVRLLKLAPAKL
jgi:hypothetical protein